MIKVKHPHEKVNRSQEEFIASCPPGQRRFHELMFTHGNIVYRYHNDAKRLDPTLEDYHEWLEGLPQNVRDGMSKLGFEGCKTVLPFTRYVMEKNDIGLEEYIKLHMEPKDYIEYKQLI